MTTPSAASRCRMNRLKVRLFHQPDFMGRFTGGEETDMTISLCQPDARIDECGKQVCRKVAEENENRREHQQPHHHRVVLIAETIEEQPAHPRPGEDRLGDKCPTKQRGHLQSRPV